MPLKTKITSTVRQDLEKQNQERKLDKLRDQQNKVRASKEGDDLLKSIKGIDEKIKKEKEFQKLTEARHQQELKIFNEKDPLIKKELEARYKQERIQVAISKRDQKDQKNAEKRKEIVEKITSTISDPAGAVKGGISRSIGKKWQNWKDSKVKSEGIQDFDGEQVSSSETMTPPTPVIDTVPSVTEPSILDQVFSDQPPQPVVPTAPVKEGKNNVVGSLSTTNAILTDIKNSQQVATVAVPVETSQDEKAIEQRKELIKRTKRNFFGPKTRFLFSVLMGRWKEKRANRLAKPELDRTHGYRDEQLDFLSTIAGKERDPKEIVIEEKQVSLLDQVLESTKSIIPAITSGVLSQKENISNLATQAKENSSSLSSKLTEHGSSLTTSLADLGTQAKENSLSLIEQQKESTNNFIKSVAKSKKVTAAGELKDKTKSFFKRDDKKKKKGGLGGMFGGLMRILPLVIAGITTLIGALISGVGMIIPVITGIVGSLMAFLGGGFAIAAAAAIAVGISKLASGIMSEEGGGSTALKLHRKSKETGHEVIDLNAWGDSYIHDWNEVEKLSPKEIQELINYDDWDDKTDRKLARLKAAKEEGTFVSGMSLTPGDVDWRTDHQSKSIEALSDQSRASMKADEVERRALETVESDKRTQSQETNPVINAPVTTVNQIVVQDEPFNNDPTIDRSNPSWNFI
jgi:hypothetical protein